MNQVPVRPYNILEFLLTSPHRLVTLVGIRECHYLESGCLSSFEINNSLSYYVRLLLV
jgi:hypothetical protein